MANINEIISKYTEVYPEVEKLLSSSNALYKQGLEDIENLYNEWNISGADKARYIAEYISDSTATMVNSAMRVSLSLVEKAVSPADEYQNMQLQILERGYVASVLQEIVRATSDMMGMMSSGGFEPPIQVVVANKEILFKLLSLLRDLDGNAVFTKTEIDAIRNYTV